MSDDPPEENEGAICVKFLDTQICVDDNGTISVYTGAVDGESDDGFRVVATACSVVGDYFDSVEDVERRLREWADENRDRIDACIRHAREIASLSARVGHLEASLDAVRATLRAVLSDALSMGEYLARKDAEIEKLNRERDEARAALQPFATEAHRYDPDDGDDLHPAWDLPFQIRHLRAARKAMGDKP